jgi:hypothetical protein
MNLNKYILAVLVLVCCFKVLLAGEKLTPHSVNEALSGKFNGQELIISGEMLLGLEAGVLYPSKTPRYQMPFQESIHIEFDGWFEREISHLPVHGDAIVKGRLKYDNIKGYGHMGINKFCLISPTVIKWPSPLSEIIFFCTYIFSPLVLLVPFVLIVRKIRKDAMKNGVIAPR